MVVIANYKYSRNSRSQNPAKVMSSFAFTHGEYPLLLSVTLFCDKTSNWILKCPLEDNYLNPVQGEWSAKGLELATEYWILWEGLIDVLGIEFDEPVDIWPSVNDLFCAVSSVSNQFPPTLRSIFVKDLLAIFRWKTSFLVINTCVLSNTLFILPNHITAFVKFLYNV